MAPTTGIHPLRPKDTACTAPMSAVASATPRFGVYNKRGDAQPDTDYNRRMASGEPTPILSGACAACALDLKYASTTKQTPNQPAPTCHTCCGGGDGTVTSRIMPEVPAWLTDDAGRQETSFRLDPRPVGGLLAIRPVGRLGSCGRQSDRVATGTGGAG